LDVVLIRCERVLMSSMVETTWLTTAPPRVARAAAERAG
jgi:hypothetical protein